jgi:hypothetical protein
MLISENLIKYTITQENSDKVITYFTEGVAGSITELAKIALDQDILSSPDKNLALIQLLVTPHVHISLLEAISPFIENLIPQLEGEQLKQSLLSWVKQTKSILNHD